MPEFELTRRKALAGIGGAAVVGGAVLATDPLRPSWHTADTDTTETLHDVQATATNLFAVGSNGRVIERTGDAVWTTRIEDGPSGNGNNLLAADVTDDGRRLWVTGASGALGEYDVETGELVDHGPLGADGSDDTGPKGKTSNFDGLAVSGDAGAAHVYLTDQSGHVLTSHDNGQSWSETTPGSGATISAIDLRGVRAGHLCDTAGAVFSTADGDRWEKVGIEDADANYYGVESDGVSDIYVVGGNGTVRTYDGASWGESSLGDAALNGIETTAEGEGAAVGEGGVVFVNPGTWTRAETPTDENLKNVTVGDVSAAVGASGTVVEK